MTLCPSNEGKTSKRQYCSFLISFTLPPPLSSVIWFISTWATGHFIYMAILHLIDCPWIKDNWLISQLFDKLIEWLSDCWCRLRSLSDSGSQQSSSMGVGGGQQYKLAEHRYGREELLALYKITDSITPDLSDTSIMLAKPAEPMALIPMSEEEQVHIAFWFAPPVSQIERWLLLLFMITLLGLEWYHASIFLSTIFLSSR